MKIGIDFDDTIVDSLGELLKLYNSKTGKNLKKTEVNSWDWGKVLGLSRKESDEIVDEFLRNHKVEEQLQIEGAVESIKSILKEHEVKIITSRNSIFKHTVEGWIKHYIGENIKVIPAGDWHKQQGATKAEICKKLGIRLIVEDAPSTAIECAKSGIKVILFDKPWNQGIADKNITRVFNWLEAVKEIDNICH